MESMAAAFAGAVGSVAFFGCIAFSVWIDYRKKKDERDAAYAERLKALEMGYPPQEAEIERARAESSAAWAAGLIGILVPIFMALVAMTLTLVAVLRREPGESLSVTPFVVGWGIAGMVSMMAIQGSLRAIRERGRKANESTATRRERVLDAVSDFQEKPRTK